jgi:hypothetical protein
MSGGGEQGAGVTKFIKKIKKMLEVVSVVFLCGKEAKVRKHAVRVECAWVMAKGGRGGGGQLVQTQVRACIAQERSIKISM